MFNQKQVTELKSLGFLMQKDKQHFSVRFLSKAGNFTTEEISHISEVANKFGKGYMGITSRMCIEVPWINWENVENVIEYAKNVGLKHGGTGKKLRPIVACKGTICQHGNIDTQALAGELHEKLFFTLKTHAKCKVGIVGCANNCIKANLNDIGILGYTVPKFNYDKCVGCGMCIKSCRQKALTLDTENKKVILDRDKCVDCGCCVRACRPGGFTVEDQGAKIFIGGRFGRGYSMGTCLPIRFKEDKVIESIEKILNYYIENGEDGERISKMMDRLGEEKVINDLVNILS